MHKLQAYQKNLMGKVFAQALKEFNFKESDLWRKGCDGCKTGWPYDSDRVQMSTSLSVSGLNALNTLLAYLSCLVFIV